MRTHTTSQGCTVTARAVGESVEIVVRQGPLHREWCASRKSALFAPACDCGAGSVQTFACSQADALAIGSMLVETWMRPSGPSGDEPCAHAWAATQIALDGSPVREVCDICGAVRPSDAGGG